MFWNQATTKEKIYNLVDKIENFKARMQLLPVNFQKPWWDIILRQKKSLAIIFLAQIIFSSFDAVFPIMIGYTILRLDLNLFMGLVGLKMLTLLISNLSFRTSAILEIQTMGSIEYQANQYFLSVDPIYHTTKSSGQIVSKINRGSGSYEDVLDIIGFDLLGIFTSMITITVTMFIFSLQLGIICLFSIILISGFSVLANSYRTKIFQPRRIKAEDVFKTISLETLLQVPFIRATFASNEQTEKLGKTLQNSLVKKANVWQSVVYVSFATKILLSISVVIIGYLVLIQAKNGTIDTIIALSIILAYTSGTQQILSAGRFVNRLTTALANIDDLFDFIQSFGTQSFPVLETESNQPKEAAPVTPAV